MLPPSLRAPVLAALLSACTPTPSVVLEFPDSASELEAASFTVAALPLTGDDCTGLMATGIFTSPIQVITGALPLGSPAHLGVVPRGQTLFFAEVRDGAARPFLRACTAAGAGGEIVLPLQRVNRPPEFTAPGATLMLAEMQTLDVGVVATDPDGTPVTVAARDLPDFATFDAQTLKLSFTPGPTGQGVYTFELDATEQRPQGVTVTLVVTLTVTDVPRPMVWNRLYRGWQGRFDSAALWDADHHQLLVSGGRDVGVDLTLPTLFTSSSAPDVLSDYRALEFDDDPPQWNKNQVIHASSSGKYGHVMGLVKSQDTNVRLGFVIGGSDGSQVSPESLLITLGRISNAMAPFTLEGSSFFLTGMATAIDSDESSTYLFGGDLAFSDFHNEVFQVTAPSEDSLSVTELNVSPLLRPPARTQSTLVLALNPKRLVVIGGRSILGASEVHFNDAWQLCLEVAPPKCPAALAWSQILPTGDTFPGSGAPGVFALVAGYDAPRDRVITYGGLGVVAGKAWLFEDAFALDLSASAPVDAGTVSATWTKLASPEQPTGPYGLVAAASAYDADAGRLLLYAGMTGKVVEGQAQLDITDDVWQLGLSAGNEQLTRVPAIGLAPYPERRVSPSLTSRGDPLLFGGEGAGTDPTDEWAVRPDGGVEAIVIPGDSPLPRAQFDLVYNPDLDEYWGYGGRVGNLRPIAALYRLRADAGFTEVDQELDTEPRFGQATIYDRVNHHLVIFGGIGGSGSLGDIETLTLVGGTVQTDAIVPDSGTLPDPRYGMVSGYDRARQRMIIFGGTKTVSGSETDTQEVWQLSLVAGQEVWSQITATGSPPPPMYLPGGVLTAENPPVLYVVGTVNRPPLLLPQFVDGFWKLTLTPGSETWTQLTLPDFRPRPRLFPTTVYDELQHRLLLTSGAQDPVFRNDVWALTLP